MCKIKQLNGDAPRMNNYCTAREYEVLTIIAKDETLKIQTFSGKCLHVCK